MSVPSDPIQIGGVAVAGPVVSAAHGAGGVAGGPGGVLAFTGAGPGTLPLLIAGLVSAIVGGVLVLFGRDSTRTRSENGLADLSARVD